MEQTPSLLSFGKELYRIWITERPTQFAAALAYYAIFSFVPVIYIAFTVADLFVARLLVAEQFYAQVANLLGDELAYFVRDAVTNLAEGTTGGTILTSLIGFVALAFSASMVFFQLQHTLNAIWKVPPPSRSQTHAYVRDRLLAFVMVLGVVLLLIVAAVINLVISIFDAYVDFRSPVPVASFFAFAGLATLSFALIYKMLSNARVAWRDVWVGAAVTAVLVTAGVYLVGFYLGASRFGSALEAAGAVALFLMGFYFLGQIFVFGAVFTRVYAGMFGSKILPRKEASAAGQEPPEESVHSEDG
jgi:membrane protein